MRENEWSEESASCLRARLSEEGLRDGCDRLFFWMIVDDFADQDALSVLKIGRFCCVFLLEHLG